MMAFLHDRPVGCYSGHALAQSHCHGSSSLHDRLKHLFLCQVPQSSERAPFNSRTGRDRHSADGCVWALIFEACPCAQFHEAVKELRSKVDEDETDKAQVKKDREDALKAEEESVKARWQKEKDDSAATFLKEKEEMEEQEATVNAQYCEFPCLGEVNGCASALM